MEMYQSHMIDNLPLRLIEMERAISKREKDMDDSIAKVFLADLTLLYKRFADMDMKIDPFDADFRVKADKFYPKITKLRIQLTKIISRYSSQPATKTPLNNPSHQPNQPEPKSDLDLKHQLFQTQKFLIKQIESVEINDDVCPVKARVLYDHVEKLYERFISNQVQIDAQVDEAAIVLQQAIASETQQKVIDTQTRLKKIITPNVQIEKIASPLPATSSADLNQTSSAAQVNSSGLENHPQTKELGTENNLASTLNIIAISNDENLKISRDIQNAVKSLQKEVSLLRSGMNERVSQLNKQNAPSSNTSKNSPTINVAPQTHAKTSESIPVTVGLPAKPTGSTGVFLPTLNLGGSGMVNPTGGTGKPAFYHMLVPVPPQPNSMQQENPQKQWRVITRPGPPPCQIPPIQPPVTSVTTSSSANNSHCSTAG